MKEDIKPVFGVWPVLEAIESGSSIEKVFIQRGIQHDELKQITSKLKDREIPFQFVPVQKLNKITGKNHQGIIALVSPVPYQRIETVLPGIYESGETPLFVMLDGITDVRNYGAIARSAKCARVHGLIVPLRGGAQSNAVAIKTSAGALLDFPVCREPNLTTALDFLVQSGLQAVALTEHTDDLIYDIDFELPTVLVAGSEETGISKPLLQRCTARARIPMPGGFNSLNVSVATGIALFESVRQRQLSNA